MLQLSEFCTDEVFTVLTHQLRDRKGEELKIAVETLDAKLLGVITEGSEYVAAVHFTGRLKVSGGNTDEIENVNEVWSLTRPVENGNQAGSSLESSRSKPDFSTFFTRNPAEKSAGFFLLKKSKNMLRKHSVLHVF